MSQNLVMGHFLILWRAYQRSSCWGFWLRPRRTGSSEEHTSELQSPDHLVCRLLLEKKTNTYTAIATAARPSNHPLPSGPCRQTSTISTPSTNRFVTHRSVSPAPPPAPSPPKTPWTP